ncbi:MAG: helix-turn-helix domain-containing protein [Proteobacteria bacterium]|nr:helix-turn-helix domain-containing protein [Pseudomonadota bacterium]NIS71732.1 helix-turn-helix domain-containing protein [Pseudomonadota bacterium]
MDIGKKLKEVRRLRGISLRALGKRIEVSASFLSQVEQGKCRPSLETLGRISAALEVKADYFLRDEEKPAKEVLEIKLPNRLKYLSVVGSLVTEACRVHQIHQRDVEDILLAIDEACTNIIKYAYDVGSLRDFTIRLTFDPGMVSIHFEDKGTPFNPVNVNLLNPEIDMGRRNVTGMGIYLMKKVMDKVEYQYSVERGNCLTLTKKVSDSSGSQI